MTLKPCVVPDCGEPSEKSRCAQHRKDTRDKRERGYDWAWDQLSRRARKLQPFCIDCGATEDLQADHTPNAWARKAAGRPIRIKDIDVVCGPCNRKRGSARPGSTRADQGPRPQHFDARPDGKARRAMNRGVDALG